MYPKYTSLIFSLVVIYFSICSCSQESEPVSPFIQIYETSYGIVKRIDNYPLFTLNYSSDYKLEEYLQTGIIPNYNLSEINSRQFSCTCFSALGNGNRILARNYDWSEHSTYYILFTNPPNGYSSISTVDLSFFNYNHDE